MTCIMSYWVTSKFISVEHTKDQKRLAKLLSSFDNRSPRLARKEQIKVPWYLMVIKFNSVDTHNPIFRDLIGISHCNLSLRIRSQCKITKVINASKLKCARCLSNSTCFGTMFKHLIFVFVFNKYIL